MRSFPSFTIDIIKKKVIYGLSDEDPKRMDKILMPPRERLFLIVFALLALPAIVQAQFTFTTNGDALAITGYTGPGGLVVIPNTTNGYTITGIEAYAFEDGTNLTSVTIPGSVTNIGVGPFLGCASLTNISVNAGNPSFSSTNGVLFDLGQDTLMAYPAGLTNGAYAIPGSVTSIGQYAFASCFRLTSVVLSNCFTIGEFAFYDCAGLTSVIIPNGVTNLGTAAFYGCIGLKSAAIAGTADNLGGLAFAFCTNLTFVNFGSNAPPDDGTAFSGDPAAVVYYSAGTTGWGTTFGGAPTVGETVPAGLQYETSGGSMTITGYTGPGGVVVIPPFINGYLVTDIDGEGPNGAFEAANVTSVTIPVSVTSIGVGAFQDCISLSSVTLPNSVASIGQAAFDSCISLRSVTIPGSVTSIGDGAFEDCAGLNNAIIANGVSSIGEDMFNNCFSLTNVTIPGSVTSIGQAAFFNCTSLNSVTLPGSVTSIGVGAFQQCASLANIVIPASVTSIGVNVFNDCTSLTNISVNASNPAYSSFNGVLFDKHQYTLIAYPAGLTSGSYTIPNSVTNIGYSALEGCASLSSVIIPGSVSSIGDYAFSDDGLTSVTLPGSVTSIGDYAFNNCESLAAAYFQGNVLPDDGTIFSGDTATVYYLPGTTGWGATFGSVPTALWFQAQPEILGFEPSCGVRNNVFGFTISWDTNASVIVQACTNLIGPVWITVVTNTLNNGTNYFTDAQWASYHRRFYRIIGP
jgi:hypothetical protein